MDLKMGEWTSEWDSKSGSEGNCDLERCYALKITSRVFNCILLVWIKNIVYGCPFANLLLLPGENLVGG